MNIQIVIIYIVEIACVCSSTYPALYPRTQVSSTHTDNDTSNQHEIASTKPQMYSVMLKHVLYWNNTDQSNYTVLYKPVYRQRWTPVLPCTHINASTCDMTDVLSATLTYHIAVKMDALDDDVSFIVFNPEYNTTLLPPKFEAKRDHDVIFVRPITPTIMGRNEPITEKMSTLEYQVRYWKDGTSNDVIQQTTSMQYSEIASPKLSSLSDYCVSMRLYEQGYDMENMTSGHSVWSEPRCLNKTDYMSGFPTAKTAVIGTIIGLLSLLVGVTALVVLYRSWKMYKFIRKVDPLPQTLVQVMQEMQSPNPAHSPTNSIERIDSLRGVDDLSHHETLLGYTKLIQSTVLDDFKPCKLAEERKDKEHSSVSRSCQRNSSNGCHDVSCDGIRSDESVTSDDREFEYVQTSVDAFTEPVYRSLNERGYVIDASISSSIREFPRTDTRFIFRLPDHRKQFVAVNPEILQFV